MRPRAKQVPILAALEHLPEGPHHDYAVDALERMFTYYNRHGLNGNPNVLRRNTHPRECHG